MESEAVGHSQACHLEWRSHQLCSHSTRTILALVTLFDTIEKEMELSCERHVPATRHRRHSRPTRSSRNCVRLRQLLVMAVNDDAVLCDPQQRCYGAAQSSACSTQNVCSKRRTNSCGNQSARSAPHFCTTDRTDCFFKCPYRLSIPHHTPKRFVIRLVASLRSPCCLQSQPENAHTISPLHT